jgi:hypothetical protein
MQSFAANDIAQKEKPERTRYFISGSNRVSCYLRAEVIPSRIGDDCRKTSFQALLDSTFRCSAIQDETVHRLQVTSFNITVNIPQITGMILATTQMVNNR